MSKKAAEIEPGFDPNNIEGVDAYLKDLSARAKKGQLTDDEKARLEELVEDVFGPRADTSKRKVKDN